jgi:hypothetical protein
LPPPKYNVPPSPPIATFPPRAKPFEKKIFIVPLSPTAILAGSSTFIPNEIVDCRYRC